MGNLGKNGHRQEYEEIAIIGIAARFSQADNTDELWDNLRDGKDCVTDCLEDRKQDIEDYLNFKQIKREERKYRKAAYLKEIDKFDYEFFRIPPKEAKIMDPHQRILLETSYNAIEDSGYSVNNFNDKKVGIYVGFPTEYTCKVYQNLIMEMAPELANDSFSGNLCAMLPARLAYFLNLHGPAILVDTSCSSSLVAIHLACKGIQMGDCELALAGGINIFTVPVINHIVNAIGIVASDGKAKTFDDSCDGVGQGEGVGVILLKPLCKAIRDKDNIYAVIKSSACNQDGKSIGITAPSISAQEKVLVEAWEKADINPETISYIEAHGTATKIGDPTEISGINRAFKHFTTKKQFCGVGSIKSNIGHTIGAAGVASVIKLVLSLKNKQIPATIHFKQPNSKIDFINSAVYVNNKLKKWEADYPRRCGASSFGISGTNCHVVLEEAPLDERIADYTWKYLLFTISAKSKDSLFKLIEKYIWFLKRNRSINIYNLCYTANIGRMDFEYRIAIGISSFDMLLEKLQSLLNLNYENKDEKQIVLSDIWMSDNMMTGKTIGRNPNSMLLSCDEMERRFTNKEYVDWLGRQYVSGKEINWSKIYENQEGYRISLPAYVFKKNRCWLDTPKYNKSVLEQKNIYYQPTWINEYLSARDLSTDNGSYTIVFSNGDKFTNELIKKLKNQSVHVISVVYSNQYTMIDNQNYTINDIKEDYKKLFDRLECREISRIIFSGLENEQWSINEETELEEKMEYGIYRFYRLIQAIDNEFTEGVELFLITAQTYQVTETEETLKPYNAMMIGFAKTLQWEIPMIHCKCIDINEQSSIDCVLNEIANKTKDYLVCYRGNNRFTEKIQRIELEELKNTNNQLKRKGTYILIGGLGRIGRRLSSYFQEKQANIVFISRTKFVENNLWEQRCNEEISDTLREKLNACINLERSGCKVYTFVCDVSIYEEMKNTLEYIRNNIGPINGIVQFAVDDCGKKIKEQSLEELRESLKAKVFGTEILHRLTLNDNLDFFIMFSSVMTLVSGNGVSSYVTSNSYLEAYAQYMRYKNRPAKVISWPEWLDVGLSDDLMNTEETSLFKKLPYEMGYMAFEELLWKEITRVIVGEINYSSKIYELIDYLPFQFNHEIKKEFQGTKELENESKKKIDLKVKLRGRKTSLYSKTEEILARAYYTVLGYEEINIQTNFFEMGGDSISGVKICVELENFDIELTPVELLRYQTIESIAEFIDKRMSQ